ncbi:MAG: hypothetical protein LBP55_07985 [Candidatus Adiutrix sp.]|jgi:hypothetical protein|nr:hypothetical protein [Candidatus Adiutrix sp.]
MTVKPWDDSDIARASAELDTELVEIFSEIEKLPAIFEKPALSGAQQYDEIGLPEAEILEEEAEGSDIRPPEKAAARVADLSPDELARLVERAAARGVLEALKKRF